ncbi:flagellar filament capping protein FliD [Thalassotalea sp. G20_0]|uniref:flagellar filament capping protein FliD n=1 Tax=Thalassotalea sp. G20_0 TaxID=2821093 RepID=UPI001AD9F498|nr:flagellar filament capping protein FliD [Thalassotalea sp. G20_0]MBO9495289.1 flagellar filament capping protein FliD [Thalassotalea sp. G20_0]
MNPLSPLPGSVDMATVVDAVVNAEMAPSENALKRREEQLSREQDLMVSVYQAVHGLQHAARALVQEASINTSHSNGNGNGNGHGLGRWVAISSEPDRVGVSVRGRPDPGSYQLSVHQLASPQIMVSPPFAKETVFNDAGTLNLALNGGQWKVNIAANSTLTTIARSIQLATRGKVRATAINGKEGQQLLLTGAEKGADLRMTLSGTGAGAWLAGIMTEQVAPADALVSINGVTLYLPGNVNQPVINGLNLTLKQADPDRQLYIEVSQDVEALVSAMSDFVNHCNSLLKTSDPRDSRGQQIDAGAPASLRSISSQLRKLVNATPAETELNSSEQITSLLDLGVSTERSGLWSLDESWFRHQLNAMPYQVLQFLSDREKPVLALARKMDTLLSGNGPLLSRISYLSHDLQRLASDQYAMDTRRQLLHQRTNQQFLNMEQTVQRMNRNRDYVDNM